MPYSPLWAAMKPSAVPMISCIIVMERDWYACARELATEFPDVRQSSRLRLSSTSCIDRSECARRPARLAQACRAPACVRCTTEPYSAAAVDQGF